MALDRAKPASFLDLAFDSEDMIRRLRPWIETESPTIARAVMLKPDVLVADEAVSALDVSVQAQVLDLLAELQRQTGIAIIFITHDLRVAAQICDDVLVMQRGRVVEQGPAAEVLHAPKNDYTRSLIDAAPGRFWDFAAGRPLVA